MLKLNCLLFPPVPVNELHVAAGRRLIRLDKELEGRGERPVKQSEGREGRSGAVWCAHARPSACMCSAPTSIHGNCVLIISVFLLENTHRVDQVDGGCGRIVACNSFLFVFALITRGLGVILIVHLIDASQNIASIWEM